MKKYALFALVGLFSHIASAQKTTIINHYEGEASGADDRQYVLRTTEEHTVVINYYEIASDGDEGRMRDLISDALDFCIDRSILVENNTISLRNKPSLLLKDLDQIVQDAIRYYHFREMSDFQGFSSEVLAQLEDLDGKEIPSNWDPEFQGRPFMDKQFAFIEKEVNQLKAALRQEVDFFTNGNLFVQVDSQEKQLDAEQQAMLDDVRGFKTNDSLSAMEISFSNETLNLIASEDEFILPTFETLPESDLSTDLADRILTLLEDNTQRIDDVALQVEANNETAAEVTKLRADVSELKALVQSLISEIQSGGTAPSPVTSIPSGFEGFSVYFSSGATYLTTEGKLQLNALIDLLASRPDLKVMLTGFADAVGNPDQNLKLSKARAESVRYHLAQSGIAKHRVLVNYFGEDRATGSKSDRRVEVKVLPS